MLSEDYLSKRHFVEFGKLFLKIVNCVAIHTERTKEGWKRERERERERERGGERERDLSVKDHLQGLRKNVAPN